MHSLYGALSLFICTIIICLSNSIKENIANHMNTIKDKINSKFRVVRRNCYCTAPDIIMVWPPWF